MEKYKNLLKNVGIMTLGNFSSKILVFLMVPLYTSVLSTTEYGIYELSASTVQLLMPVLSLNIIDAVMRFVMERDISIKQTVTIGLKYTIGSFMIASIFFAFCYCSRCFRIIKGYEFFILVFYVFSELNQFGIQLAKGLERLNLIAISAVLGTAIMLIFNVLFLLVFRIGLRGFFLANILAQAVPSIYLVFRLRIWDYLDWGEKTDTILRKNMLSYSVPLIATAVGWWTNNTADKYAVAFMCGTAASGLLSVAYKIPGIINTVQSVFIQAWQVSAIKEYEEERDTGFYNITFLYFNMLMCFSCTILIAFVKPIARIMFFGEFNEAWRYVPFLLVSSVLNAAAGYLGPILGAQKNTIAMASSAVYGTVVNVFLNIILVKVMGIQGATIATVWSSYIIFAIRKHAIGNILGGKYYWRILTSWGLLCLQALIEIYTKWAIGHAVVMLGFALLYLDGLKKMKRKLCR